jgi:hypothetical protein
MRVRVAAPQRAGATQEGQSSVLRPSTSSLYSTPVRRTVSEVTMPGREGLRDPDAAADHVDDEHRTIIVERGEGRLALGARAFGYVNRQDYPLLFVFNGLAPTETPHPGQVLGVPNATDLSLLRAELAFEGLEARQVARADVARQRRIAQARREEEARRAELVTQVQSILSQLNDAAPETVRAVTALLERDADAGIEAVSSELFGQQLDIEADYLANLEAERRRAELITQVQAILSQTHATAPETTRAAARLLESDPDAGIDAVYAPSFEGQVNIEADYRRDEEEARRPRESDRTWNETSWWHPIDKLRAGLSAQLDNLDELNEEVREVAIGNMRRDDSAGSLVENYSVLALDLGVEILVGGLGRTVEGLMGIPSMVIDGYMLPVAHILDAFDAGTDYTDYFIHHNDARLESFDAIRDVDWGRLAHDAATRADQVWVGVQAGDHRAIADAMRFTGHAVVAVLTLAESAPAMAAGYRATRSLVGRVVNRARVLVRERGLLARARFAGAQAGRWVFRQVGAPGLTVGGVGPVGFPLRAAAAQVDEVAGVVGTQADDVVDAVVHGDDVVDARALSDDIADASTAGSADLGEIATANTSIEGSTNAARMAPLTTAEANALGGSNRGLIEVLEELGTPRSAAMRSARDFESGTAGAYSDVATQHRVTPALRFDNPNPNGNSFVRFDGIEGDSLLIDAKTRLLTFTSRGRTFVPQADDLRRVSEAIRQNPGFRVVLEFPSAEAMREARQILRTLNISNISTRVR